MLFHSGLNYYVIRKRGVCGFVDTDSRSWIYILVKLLFHLGNNRNQGVNNLIRYRNECPKHETWLKSSWNNAFFFLQHMSQTDSLTFFWVTIPYKSLKHRRFIWFLNSRTRGGVELTIVIDPRIKNEVSLRDFAVTLGLVFSRKLINKEAVSSEIRELKWSNGFLFLLLNYVVFFSGM